MQNAIVNAEQAINRANLLTGLRAISETPTAVSASLTGDVTPYLGEENEGKAIWRVTYPNSALVLPSAQAGYVDPYRRSFGVVLEAVLHSLRGPGRRRSQHEADAIVWRRYGATQQRARGLHGIRCR
jgi:hypothetical protein